MSADERLVVMLEARITEFEKRMGQAEQRGTRTYQGLRRGWRSATQQMAADMNRSTASVNKALASTSAKIGAFSKAFAGGLVCGVIASAFAGLSSNVAATMKGIAQLGNEAKRAGISAQAFQEWKFVAEANRISVDSLVDGFKELSLRADEFITTGVVPAAEAFTRLGYRSDDLKRKLKDPSALMLEIMGRLEGLDKAAQIRVADEIFGGTGGERFVELLGQGQGAIAATIAEAHKAGAVLDDEMIAKADEIDRKFNQITDLIRYVLIMLGKRWILLDQEGAFDLYRPHHHRPRSADGSVIPVPCQRGGDHRRETGRAWHRHCRDHGQHPFTLGEIGAGSVCGAGARLYILSLVGVTDVYGAGVGCVGCGASAKRTRAAYFDDDQDLSGGARTV